MKDKVKKSQVLNQLANTPRKGLYKLKDNQVTDDFNVLVINKADGKVYEADKSAFTSGEVDLYTLITALENIDLNTLDGTETFVITHNGVAYEITLPELITTITYNSNKGFLEKLDVPISRNYLSTDKNKILFLNSGVQLTLDIGETFEDGDIIAVAYGFDSPDDTAGFNISNAGSIVLPYTSIDSTPNETVYLSALNISGQTVLIPISTFIKPDVNDGNKLKTGLRYLMDNSLNAIPLSGTATLASGTVTVSDIRVKTEYKIYVSVNTPNGTQGFLSAPTGSIVNGTSFVINSTSVLDDSTVNWWITP